MTGRVPANWPTVALGSILTTQKGKRPKNLLSAPTGDAVPYIDIAAVERGTKRQWSTRDSCLVVPAGTLVMVWDGARSGWVGRTRFEGALGSTLSALHSPVATAYLEWFLRARFAEINGNPRGSGIPHVNPDLLRSLSIPVPPEAEQRRLVDLVERVLRAKATAAEHVVTARRTLARYSLAVIDAACSGRLPATAEGLDLEVGAGLAELRKHGKENPDLLVNTRRTKPARGVAVPDQSDQFPDSWAYCRIRELVALRAIVDVQDGNHGELYPRRTDFGERGVPFISAENVDDEVHIDRAPLLRREVANHLRVGFAQPGDVILTHNATVGRVAIVPTGAPQLVLSTSTTYYRTDSRVLLSEYLALFMRSRFFQNQLHAIMEQTTRNQVPVTKQVELQVAVPPRAVQQDVVERVRRLLGNRTSAEGRIRRASTHLERSVEALLGSTFGSELHDVGTAVSK